MNCNVCGGEIPAGATSCPICGAPVPTVDAAPAGGFGAPADPQPADPFAGSQPAQAPQYGGYDPMAPQTPQPGAYDPFGAAPVADGAVPAVKPPKSHTGLIIGIIVGVAVVAALVIMWVLGVFGGSGGADGTYTLDSANAFGIQIEKDQLSTYGLDGDKFKLKINGGKAEISMAGREANCDVEISGDKVTFKNGSETLEGKYDKGAGKITISYSGIELVFKK